jgi:AraC family transcriptional regulator of arabinose operon
MRMNADPRIAWAVTEMERRMAEEVSLDELARTVNLSRSRFAHLFRQQTGRAPGKHLRQLRLERARMLLETTFLSVKEVMAAVGLNDPSHFSRDFQAAYGASPREWRKRVARSPGLELATTAK